MENLAKPGDLMRGKNSKIEAFAARNLLTDSSGDTT